MSPEADEVEYQLIVLRRMIECLPDRQRDLLLGQLGKVVEAFAVRDSALCQAISTKVDDVVLDVKAMQFDLEATRRERDQLQERLDSLS